MIRITDRISIGEDEIIEEFIRASGPGGQHVNKAATAVQLRFDIQGSSLPEEVKGRLMTLAGRKVTGKGELVITARRLRSLDDNRKDALERLVELVRRAAEAPKVRKKTKATIASKKKRLEAKRRHAVIKKKRGRVKPTEE